MTATTEQTIYDEKQLFSTRQAPWMKLGTVIEDEVTSAEAAKLGGLDFEVELRKAGRIDKNGKWVEAEERKSVVRTDTDDFFGYVSNDYAPVQYADAFSFMDEINSKFTAAGALKGGRQGFMVVKLPDSIDLSTLELKGVSDPHELYVVLRTSHDRSKGIEICLMTLRNLCMNQLTLPSLTADVPQRWAIRHIGKPEEKMREAAATLKRADKYARRFLEMAENLADIPVAVDHAERLVRAILPDRPRRDQQVQAITSAFQNSEFVGFAGTGWGLVNAVSEYFEWQRTGARTTESRFTCGLDGPAHRYVGRTAQLLLANA